MNLAIDDSHIHGNMNVSPISMQSPPTTPRRVSLVRTSMLTSVPEDSEFLMMPPTPRCSVGSFSPPSPPSPTSTRFSGPDGSASPEDSANLVKKLRRMKRRLLLEQVNKPIHSINLTPSLPTSAEQ
uniref:Uncharacterized protein n=1 Tax=Craspedostauros australis TaxID=1486917 RepID=A0A6T6GF86_9STRA|mmetsp:Transcript_19990/g.55603  ORF Transcript_19990/g.55603 Transcript_19990/m.55603 type:complete len:126 (+) Transcript_19990:253-630(+)